MITNQIFQEIILNLIKLKDRFIWASSQSWFSPFIDVISLFLLFMAAREAFRSSRAASEANELKLLPLLGIFINDKRLDGYEFTLKNFGEGVAYDISVDPWTLIMQDIHSIIECKMNINDTNILSKNDEKKLSFVIKENGRRVSSGNGLIVGFMKHLEADIQIQFKDARGKRWATLIKITSDQVRIIKPPYCLSLINMLSIWYGLKVQRSLKIQLEKMFWRFEPRQFSVLPNYFHRALIIVRRLIKQIMTK